MGWGRSGGEAKGRAKGLCDEWEGWRYLTGISWNSWVAGFCIFDLGFVCMLACHGHTIPFVGLPLSQIPNRIT